MKFFKEFKDFINKGNVVDMAVGVVIATAFGKITSSLVNDIIMPLVGMLLGDINLTELKYVIAKEVPATANAAAIPEVAVRYGMFIQYIVDFLIVALAVFIFIKILTKAGNKSKELRNKGKNAEVVEEAPAPAPEPSNEEKLLTEIRDLLKENK